VELGREIKKLHCDSTKKQINIGEVSNIIFPFFKMGKVTSQNLFELDELIIFSLYFANRSKYRRVLDLGANIGLHSLILLKLGYSVTSYEPDPYHLVQFKLVMQLNEITDFNLIPRAISNKKDILKFIHIEDNSTGSHLLGAKESVYGKTKILEVETDNINDVLNDYDFELVKMDIEGHENLLIRSIDAEFFNKIDIILEIGSLKNSIEIFDHLVKLDIPCYSQKNNWKRVSNLNDLPSHYSEGSCFISTKGPPNWIP
jgi:FkbM family methyltransferase